MNTESINWFKWLFFISITGNIVQFFKPIINDFLFHKVKSKEKEREKLRASLIKTRDLLWDYSVSFPLVATFLYKARMVDNQMSFSETMELLNKHNSQYATSVKDLDGIKVEVDKSIRTKLTKILVDGAGCVNLASQDPPVNILGFCAKIEEVSQDCKQLRNEIEQKLTDSR